MKSDARIPRHVAVIMDGNGRWATARGLPREAGHRQGTRAVAAVVEAALRSGVETLTLYAFSADNWRRPPAETRGLMALFREYLQAETVNCVARGIRVSVIGRRDRLPPSVRRLIELAEHATAGSGTLHLRLAIDYSSREAIWCAVESFLDAGERRREDLMARLGSGRGVAAPSPDVDLLVRTGGERRLSDFLLWECAYAELHFLDVAWPDFTAAHFEDALAAFARRDRRFGGLVSA